MGTVIIKYNAGNIFSVKCALNRIGVDATVSDNLGVISSADRVIFPGVGEAASAMRYLHSHGLDSVIKALKCPVLGICIGMQLLCRNSEEGNTQCLGIFDVDVKRFDNCGNHDFKIPQMGWNTVLSNEKNELSCQFPSKEEYVYFVHSYYVPVCKYTIMTADYIHPFSAAIRKDNFYAVQFHPEKSGKVGENILKNFMEL